MSKSSEFMFYYLEKSKFPLIQQVLSQAAFLGYTIPIDDTKSALNSFIKKRVADGSYPILDVIYITSLNDTDLSNFSKLSYVLPTLDKLNPVGGLTYDENGWTGNGSTGYLETYNPATRSGAKYVQNSACRGMFRSNAGSNNAMEGLVSGNNNAMFGALGLNSRVNGGSNLTGSNLNFSGAGFRAINRNTASDLQGYVEKVRTNTTQTSVGVISEKQVILRRGGNFSNGNVELYFMGDSLTEQQLNNMNDDFLDFKTEIGL